MFFHPPLPYQHIIHHFFDVVYTCLTSGSHHHSVGTSVQTTAALTPHSSVSWSKDSSEVRCSKSYPAAGRWEAQNLYRWVEKMLQRERAETIYLNLHSKWLVGQEAELGLPLFCLPTSISLQVCVHFSPLLKLFSIFLLWIHLASASSWHCTMPSSVRHSAASFTGLLLVIVSFHLL